MNHKANQDRGKVKTKSGEGLSKVLHLHHLASDEETDSNRCQMNDPSGQLNRRGDP